MADETQADLLSLTADVVAAYVANNPVTRDDLPRVIAGVHQALSSLGQISEPAAPVETYPPAVSVRKSLASREHIISLIDGKPYRSLKRHLTSHGLTPEDYRARYALPHNYPIVAPAYSEQRSALAKKRGFGRKAGSGKGRKTKR